MRIGAVLVALIDRLTRALAALGIGMVLALVVLIDADVVGRALFAAPLRGVPETVSVAIVAIVFLLVPEAARRDALTRADAVQNALGRRDPRLGAALEALSALIAALLMLRLCAAVVPLLIKAWRRDAFIGALGDFTVPLWPMRLAVALGCLALSLQLLVRATRSLRRCAARNASTP